MSQTQGIIQEPQFLRSQVVAQQPSSRSIKLTRHISSTKLVFNVLFSSLSSSYSHFSRRFYHYLAFSRFSQ